MKTTKLVPFLTDPDVTESIRGVLRAMGVRKQDLQDGVQDVYVKVLGAFARTAPSCRRPSTPCARSA